MKVSDGWQNLTIADVAAINTESLRGGTQRDFRFRYVDLSAVSRGQIDWSATAEVAFGDSPSRARRVVRAGDVLFGTVRPALQSHAAIGEHAGVPCVASTGFCVLRARDGTAEPRFLLHYVLGHEAAAEARRAEVGSSYPAVNETDIARFRILVPPLPEQGQLGAILDTTDDAIRKTEQLIVKLGQVKQGLLHDLLTRGIGDNGEIRNPDYHPEQFKDSVMGMLPREWEVSRLDCHAKRITDGSHQSVQRESSAYADVPFLFVSCVRDGRIYRDRGAWISRNTYQQISRGREPHEGMVLYTVVGSFGHAALLTDGSPVAFERNLACISPATATLLPGYLVNWLNGALARQIAGQAAVGNAQKLISLSSLKRLPLPLPPIAEQEQIIRTLVAFDSNLACELAALSKLRLLKQGLMEDLLTGRVRVTPLLEATPP